MKERFKRFLEREFRAIDPTKAAMEYRQEMLRRLMDRAQELRIKGIADDDFIYDMCIDELGDFRSELIEWQSKKVEVNKTKRKALFTAITAVGFVLLVVCAYLITSFALGDEWGKTWLIMVGGIFTGIVTAASMLCAKFFSKKKFVLARLLLAVDEVLICVFIFLVLQILFNLHMSWIIFLVMVIIVFGVDTLIALFLNSKIRHVELALFMETFCALLYVILGVTGLAPWHPTWLLCLAGVLAIIVELIMIVAARNRVKNSEDKVKLESKYVVKDEDYYTKWDD